jgi:hypothetical protein
MKLIYLSVIVASLLGAPIPAVSQSTGNQRDLTESKSQKSGNGMTIKMDLADAVTGFVIGSIGGPKDSRYWTVVDETRSYEAEFETNDELIRYYQKQPDKRKQKGIIIWGSLSHLRDAKASEAEMTAHQKKLMKNAKWMRDEKEFVSKLEQSCREHSITLWINTGLGAQDVEFTKLTGAE